MITNIFSIDWITIDLVIIFILLIILISVKIFKERTRWRKNFSNNSIIHKSYKNLAPFPKLEGSKIKKVEIYKNISIKDPQNSLIVNLYRKYNNLVKYITQGMVNYGCKVSNIKLYAKLLRKGSSHQEDIEWISSFLQGLKKYINGDNTELHYKLIIILHSNVMLPFTSLLKDSLISKIILINPKVKETLKNSINNIESINRKKVFFLFSGKKYLFFKKSNIFKLIHTYSESNKATPNITVIQKARHSFKYYETVLIGNIVKIIQEV